MHNRPSLCLTGTEGQDERVYISGDHRQSSKSKTISFGRTMVEPVFVFEVDEANLVEDVGIDDKLVEDNLRDENIALVNFIRNC